MGQPAGQTKANVTGDWSAPASGEPISFEAPGPGEWMLDTTHHGRRPLSGFLAPIMLEQFEAGMSELLSVYGLPLATIEARQVNGCLYVRPKPVGEGAKASPAPPALIMKLVARLHPELRRRNKAAAKAWGEKRWRVDVDGWFDRDRAPTVAALESFQAVDVSTLANAELIGHLEELVQSLSKWMYQGMATHGGDIIPTGDYFAHCSKWGIDIGAAAALLRGSSPASSEAARVLAPVGRAIAAADQRPATIEEIRALGPEVASTIDQWMALFGWRVIDSDDLDATTLAERPALQLAALVAAAKPLNVEDTPDPELVRRQVPAEERELFDELLTEARYGLRLRDDNVGIRWCWPVGLVRRALLEIGRRLQAEARLIDAEHAIELRPDEVGPLLLHTSDSPSADEVKARAGLRLAVEAAHPPSTLGEPEGPPPLDAFPAAMARATRAVLATIEAMEGQAAERKLTGVGIGETSYQGIARVVSGSDDALERLDEGDVLVAPFTGPAYNAILGVVGAIVVEEGGPLCHAAIVSRELNVPALIGVSGATTDIPDGARVEVDPVAGVVTLL